MPNEHQSAWRLRRSVLMTPASDRRLLEKQAASAADVAVLDLEDSAPVQSKVAARENAADALRTLDWGGKERVVRVNTLADALGVADVEAMATAGADAVLLTKVTDTRDVARAAAIIDRLGSNTRIWCMVETAASLFNLDTIATAPRMSALFMGTGDLLLDFRTRTFGVTCAEAVGDPVHVDPLLYARSRVVMTARALGLAAIDSAMGRLDIDSARSSAQKAFQLGFDGKLIATPTHIPVVHEAYGPTPADIAWAHRVIEALERAERDGIGSAVVDGEPMDGPYLGYAHGVLTRAEHVEAAAVAASRHEAGTHHRAGNPVRR